MQHGQLPDLVQIISARINTTRFDVLNLRTKEQPPATLHLQKKIQCILIGFAKPHVFLYKKSTLIILRRKRTEWFGAHASFHAPQYCDSPRPMLSFHPLLDFFAAE